MSQLKHMQSKEVTHILYESSLKMMGHETNELKLANALIDTAHTILWTARKREGAKAFIDMLETKLDEIHRARTLTAMQERTRAIEEPTNQE